MNKEERNWIFHRVFLHDPLVGWKPKKVHYMVSGNPFQRSIFFTENPYEGSYAGPYEGSNAGSNGMPNDDLKKHCDIIALMVKCVMVLV